jgi:hypothetical protein
MEEMIMLEAPEAPDPVLTPDHKGQAAEAPKSVPPLVVSANPKIQAVILDLPIVGRSVSLNPPDARKLAEMLRLASYKAEDRAQRKLAIRVKKRRR